MTSKPVVHTTGSDYIGGVKVKTDSLKRQTLANVVTNNDLSYLKYIPYGIYLQESKQFFGLSVSSLFFLSFFILYLDPNPG